MNPLYQFLLFVLMSAAALLLTACSSGVVVQAERFSGIVLDRTMVVEVGTIDGEDSRQFREELIRKIETSSTFRLAEGRSFPEATSAVLLIEGSYWPTSSEEYEEIDDDGKTKAYRTVTSRAEFDYAITDMLTREPVVEGFIEDVSTSRESVEAGSFVEVIFWSFWAELWKSIFGIDDFKDLRRTIIRRFITELSPREVIVEVILFPDGDLPGLEAGIGFARAGVWKEALREFLEVIDRSPRHPDIHKAYYNAGVAYEYTHQYALAREFLETAVRMSDEEEYRAELWRCRRYEQEYRWREGYLETLRMRMGRE